jgi:hypothetical protein
VALERSQPQEAVVTGQRDRLVYPNLPSYLADQADPAADAIAQADEAAANIEQEARKRKDGDLLLHLAIKGKASLDVVSKLLEAYPGGVRERDKDGNLPLHLAIKGKATVYECELNCGYRGTETEVAAHEQGSCRNRSAAADAAEPAPAPALPSAPEPAWDVVSKLLEAWPDGAREKDTGRDLPLHVAIHNTAPLEVVGALLEAYPAGARYNYAKAKELLDQNYGRPEVMMKVVAVSLLAPPPAVIDHECRVDYDIRDQSRSEVTLVTCPSVKTDDDAVKYKLVVTDPLYNGGAQMDVYIRWSDAVHYEKKLKKYITKSEKEGGLGLSIKECRIAWLPSKFPKLGKGKPEPNITELVEFKTQMKRVIKRAGQMNEFFTSVTTFMNMNDYNILKNYKYNMMSFLEPVRFQELQYRLEAAAAAAVAEAQAAAAEVVFDSRRQLRFPAAVAEAKAAAAAAAAEAAEEAKAAEKAKAEARPAGSLSLDDIERLIQLANAAEKAKAEATATKAEAAAAKAAKAAEEAEAATAKAVSEAEAATAKAASEAAATAASEAAAMGVATAMGPPMPKPTDFDYEFGQEPQILAGIQAAEAEARAEASKRSVPEVGPIKVPEADISTWVYEARAAQPEVISAAKAKAKAPAKAPAKASAKAPAKAPAKAAVTQQYKEWVDILDLADRVDQRKKATTESRDRAYITIRDIINKMESTDKSHAEAMLSVNETWKSAVKRSQAMMSSMTAPAAELAAQQEQQQEQPQEQPQKKPQAMAQ